MVSKGRVRTCLFFLGKLGPLTYVYKAEWSETCCQTSSLKLRLSMMYFQLAFNVCELKRTELAFNVPFRIYHGNGEIRYRDSGVDLSEF